jgi:hypothetical protein
VLDLPGRRADAEWSAWIIGLTTPISGGA